MLLLNRPNANMSTIGHRITTNPGGAPACHHHQADNRGTKRRLLLPAAPRPEHPPSLQKSGGIANGSTVPAIPAVVTSTRLLSGKNKAVIAVTSVPDPVFYSRIRIRLFFLSRNPDRPKIRIRSGKSWIRISEKTRIHRDPFPKHWL